jgi:hypothetical protein
MKTITATPSSIKKSQSFTPHEKKLDSGVFNVYTQTDNARHLSYICTMIYFSIHKRSLYRLPL